MGATGSMFSSKLSRQECNIQFERSFQWADRMDSTNTKEDVSILFTLEVNRWKGEEPSIHVKDIL